MIFSDIRSLLRPAALKLMACALVSIPAWAVEPFTVRDIRVEGLQRVEPGTVFSYLPVQVGDTFTEEKAPKLLRLCTVLDSLGTSKFKLRAMC